MWAIYSKCYQNWAHKMVDLNSWETQISGSNGKGVGNMFPQLDADKSKGLFID